MGKYEIEYLSAIIFRNRLRSYQNGSGSRTLSTPMGHTASLEPMAGIAYNDPLFITLRSIK